MGKLFKYSKDCKPEILHSKNITYMCFKGESERYTAENYPDKIRTEYNPFNCIMNKYNDIKKNIEIIFSNLNYCINNMIRVDPSENYSDRVFSNFDLKNTLTLMKNNFEEQKTFAEKKVTIYNNDINFIITELDRINNNTIAYYGLLDEIGKLEKKIEQMNIELTILINDKSSNITAKQYEIGTANTNLNALKEERKKYEDNMISSNDIFDYYSFVPNGATSSVDKKNSFPIEDAPKLEGIVEIKNDSDFIFNYDNYLVLKDYCRKSKDTIDTYKDYIKFNYIEKHLNSKFDNPDIDFCSMLSFAASHEILRGYWFIIHLVLSGSEIIYNLVDKYNSSDNESYKNKVYQFISNDFYRFFAIEDSPDSLSSFQDIVLNFLSSDYSIFSEFIISEQGVSSKLYSLEEYLKIFSETGIPKISSTFIVSKLDDLLNRLEEEVKEKNDEIEEPEEIEDPNDGDDVGNVWQPQPRRTDDTNNYTPSSSSSDPSSSSSSNESSSSSENSSKKSKEETIVVPPSEGKKEESQNEVKPEDHGSEVHVDPQPEPANPVVEPTKFVPQNESSYHGGGGYSSEGYVSTTTEESPVEEIIEDSPTSLEDVIKDNGIYPEIPRKIPIENHGTAKSSSGSNVIPIVAGLTSVGAAGLGSKAYLDHKRNNSDNDEYDEADEYEDYDETPEEVDADVIINDNPDSDLNPLNNNDSNSNEVTFDEDDYS